MSHGREYQTENVPFGGLAHAGDDTVQCVLATLLPTAFFAALDRGANSPASGAADVSTALVNDNIRDEILRISRGIAVALLIV